MLIGNIPVVYEDDLLLVVDKPAGLLTIPAPGKTQRTLTGVLNEYAGERGQQAALHPCHRLDRETSGLIIYAKGKSMQKKMMQLFKERKVHKTYTAFVLGTAGRKQGEIKNPVEGSSAITLYRVIEQRAGFAVVEAEPLTGRTNQLRLHFKAIGHPILGDYRFAFRRDFTVKAKRLCLHAGRLEFTHPATHREVRLKAALPPDLKEFLKAH